MYIILIVLALFVIGGACLAYYDEFIDAIFGGLMGGLVGLIPSFIIGGIISILIFGTAPCELQYQQNLVAMKDNTAITGSFFLGTGHIDSKMNYVYAVETDKGIMTKTLEQKSNTVYIQYTDGQPYMEYWAGTSDGWRMPETSAYYIFYLPEGTVINTFEIDLE